MKQIEKIAIIDADLIAMRKQRYPNLAVHLLHLGVLNSLQQDTRHALAGRKNQLERDEFTVS